MANNGIHEIPTKDTEGNPTHTTTGKVYSTCPFFYMSWFILNISTSIEFHQAGLCEKCFGDFMVQRDINHSVTEAIIWLYVEVTSIHEI